MPELPLVLVPLGSTEQHGPHLPFATDSLIATAVARTVADSMGAIVAPTVSYGASGEHQDFPGTASIGHDALGVLLVELVRSLSTWAGRVVFVNGHGGNVATLVTAVPQLVGERHDVAWVPCGVPRGDAHAGRTETSLMLHLAPELVDESAAVPGVTLPIGALLPRLAADGVRSVSPSGVLGDPTGASAAEGAATFGAMVSGVLRRIGGADRDERGCLRDVDLPTSRPAPDADPDRATVTEAVPAAPPDTPPAPEAVPQ